MHSLQHALDGLLRHRLDTPSPIVVRETMQRNIDRMQALADERHQHLRPHVRTHKCLEIGRQGLAHLYAQINHLQRAARAGTHTTSRRAGRSIGATSMVRRTIGRPAGPPGSDLTPLQSMFDR